MSVLQKLTEGLVKRDLQKEGAALLDKWEATGLLEGLDNDHNKNSMARLLENQASELLREASSMAAGDVEGFASVAFPIVRRVFGGLIANDLVSVQPMSLPSGLIFFLDFVYTDTGRSGLTKGESLFGGGVVGKNIISGTTDLTEDGGGFYNLANTYSSATGSVVAADTAGLGIQTIQLTAGGKLVSALTEAEKKLIKFDPDLLSNTTYTVQVLDCDFNDLEGLNRDAITSIQLEDNGSSQIQGFDDSSAGTDVMRSTTSHVRRLTQLIDSDGDGAADRLRIVLVDSAGASVDFEGTAFEAGSDKDQLGVKAYPIKTNLLMWLVESAP